MVRSWVPFGSLFSVFFGCFFRVFFGAQRVPKGSPKGSKIDEKEVSKRYLKKGPKKASKMMIFRTPQCGSSIVNNSKIDDFHVWILTPCWVPVWRSFGSPNGGKSHQKTISKKRQKMTLKNEPNLVPNGVPKWSQDCQN